MHPPARNNSFAAWRISVLGYGRFYITIIAVCYAVNAQIKYGSQQFGTAVAK